MTVNAATRTASATGFIDESPPADPSYPSPRRVRRATADNARRRGRLAKMRSRKLDGHRTNSGHFHDRPLFLTPGKGAWSPPVGRRMKIRFLTVEIDDERRTVSRAG